MAAARSPPPKFGPPAQDRWAYKPDALGGFVDTWRHFRISQTSGHGAEYNGAVARIALARCAGCRVKIFGGENHSVRNSYVFIGNHLYKSLDRTTVNSDTGPGSRLRGHGAEKITQARAHGGSWPRSRRAVLPRANLHSKPLAKPVTRDRNRRAMCCPATEGGATISAPDGPCGPDSA